jgi:heat-inducible transcriptional repressor
MEKRLERVLTCLIEDYIKTAEPVSSQALVNEHAFNVSSATIRNWFALLEQEGYLIQPHTSAGRIPSEEAYTWYVQHLTKQKLTGADAHKIHDVVASHDAQERTKQIAKTCVELTKIAVLVGMSESDTYYTGLSELFSKPEFNDWSRVISMSSVLDQLDQRLNELRKRSYTDPTVLLGEACPFGNACGSILLSFPDNTLFVFLGPIRMDYKRAKNVMTSVHDAINI